GLRRRVPPRPKHKLRVGVHIDEAVHSPRVQDAADIAGLGLAEGLGPAVDVAALRARRLALGDAPENVEVAVEIDAIAFGPRVVAAVLAPQVVDVHDVLAPVGVHAGHEPEIERLQDQLYVGRRPGAIAIRDVSAGYM